MGLFKICFFLTIYLGRADRRIRRRGNLKGTKDRRTVSKISARNPAIET
jgi:hypothetical protein